MLPTAWTFALNTESTWDWEGEEWNVPVNAVVSKGTKVGSQLVSVGGSLRYWAKSPDSGAEGLGVRFVSTLLFPKCEHTHRRQALANTSGDYSNDAGKPRSDGWSTAPCGL